MFDCAFPRADHVLCANHAWQASQAPSLPVQPARQRAHGELQRELLDLLRSAGRPMRSTEVAHLHRVDPSLTSKTLSVLVDKGLAEKLALGTYAAVSL